MIALDKIRDFNEVMLFFERALNFTRKLRYNIKIDELKSEIKPSTEQELISYYRAMISSETLRIIQVEEMFNKSGKINNEFDSFFVGHSLLKSLRVHQKQEFSENYKIRQLRNCLVHSMYEIRLSNDGENVYLYINNGKIKGSIKFEDFIEIANKYTSWYNDFLQYKNVGILTFDEKCLDIGDKKKAINKFVRSIRISNASLSEERMATLKKWIERIGITSIRNPKAKGEELQGEKVALSSLISDMVNCTAKNEDDVKVYEPIKENYYSVIFNFLLVQLQLYFNNSELEEFINDKKIKDKEKDTYEKKMEEYKSLLDSKNQKSQQPSKAFQRGTDFITNVKSTDYKWAINRMLKLLSVKKPFAYTDIIMSLSYYIFNYIREINQYRTEEIFDYINIDTSGFDVTYEEYEGSYERNINLKHIYYSEKDPAKKEALRKKICRYGEYVKDSSFLFRHIRDSIAHGWNKVDYSKYFNTRNIDEIIFTFPTYSPKDRSLDFEVKVSARELLKIIECFKQKINEGINLSEDGKKIEEEALKESLVYQNVKKSEIQQNTQQLQNNNRTKIPEDQNSDGR